MPRPVIRFLLALTLLCAAGGAVVEPARSMQLRPGPIQDYLFREGKTHYDAGRYAAATEVWEHILPDELFGPPAYILSARACRKSGRNGKALDLLDEFLKKHEDGNYRRIAEDERLEILCDQGSPEARDILSRRLAAADRNELPDVLLRAARLARDLGDYERASRHYRTLFIERPATVPGLCATEELAWLVFLGKIPAPDFSASDLEARARRLYRKGRFDLAADAYRKLLEDEPSDLRLQMKLARCLYKNRENHKAIAVLKEILRRDIPADERMQATHTLSLLYWRLDWDREFVTCCEAMIERGSPRMKRKALFNLGAHHLEHHRFDRAEKRFKQVLESGPGPSTRPAVMWKLAWIAYLREDYDRAARLFREIRELRTDRRLDLAARYWEARSLMRVGRKSAAEDLLEDTADRDPLGYYGLRAQEILSRSLRASFTNGRSFPELELAASERSDPRIAKAVTLMDNGLHEFALADLDALPRSKRSSPGVTYLRARAAYGAEKYRRAYDILASRFRGHMLRPPPGAPKDFVEIAFPRVHSERIVATAARHSIDPYLVWAVIRQESMYDSDAVSPAGALGLMQVTPRATEHGKNRRIVPAKAIAEILEPSNNLEYGIGILASNLNSFDGRLVPAIASYNADIRKVKQWVRRNGRLEEDEFIETIPYSETRLYVKKILAGYKAYRFLHKRKDLAGLW